MSSKKKKIYPGIKKKLTSFLTDESWKITKKDALGLSAWAVLLSSADEALAWHYSHSSAWSPALPAGSQTVIIPGPWTCGHASWVVSGHYSGTPAVNYGAWQTYTHSNHSNHWSGGWC